MLRIGQILLLFVMCALVIPCSAADGSIPVIQRVAMGIAKRESLKQVEDLLVQARRMDQHVFESTLALPLYTLYQIDPRLIKLRKITRDDIIQLIKDVSKDYSVNPAIILAITRAESNFNPKAVSPKGATGLMQVLPSTAKEMGLDAHNIVENVIAGTKYFLKVRAMFNGYTKLGLAAYNAGPGNVKNMSIPNFEETRNYVDKVYKYYRQYQKGELGA